MSLSTQNQYGLIPDILRQSKDHRCTGFYSRPNTSGKISYCALGTLMHYAGINDKTIFFNPTNKEARTKMCLHYGIDPDKRKIMMECPKCRGRGTMFGLIAHLNDGHDLKWGEIADCLEKARPFDETLSQWQKLKATIKFITSAFLPNRIFDVFTKSENPN